MSHEKLYTPGGCKQRKWLIEKEIAVEAGKRADFLPLDNRLTLGH